MPTKVVRELLVRIERLPYKRGNYELLAEHYSLNKQWKEAAETYERLIKNVGENSISYFNLAYYQKLNCQYVEAIKNYQKALELGIDMQEEVYVNIAIIYSDYLRNELLASSNLLKAIQLNERYIPALYNLANLREDEGNKEAAVELFKRILQIDRSYFNALARLANLSDIKSINDELVNKIKSALASNKVSRDEYTNLQFSLGKIYDNCQIYSLAFKHYQLGNNCDKKLYGEFNQKEFETNVKLIIDKHSSLQTVKNDNQHSPIFICGMFRSGSTLVEQILAAHNNITATGEREFFIRLSNSNGLDNVYAPTTAAEVDKLAQSYLNDIKSSFPNAQRFTDKRPENFLYVGLIKLMFPKAKIIHTERNPLDNCLSIYFQRLGKSMAYSNDLETIADYYNEQAKIIEYWKSVFPDDIYSVNYDSLVADKEREIKNLISFIEEPWEEQCLEFHKVSNVVKTASVWQVRKPLYKSSSSRWLNYENEIALLKQKFS